MPKFNIDRIRQIIGEINFASSKLEAMSKLDEEHFIKNHEKIDSAKYNLIVVIEGAIDICNHIVAKAGGRAPNDYADCFAILGELGVLTDALTSTWLLCLRPIRFKIGDYYSKEGNFDRALN